MNGSNPRQRLYAPVDAALVDLERDSTPRLDATRRIGDAGLVITPVQDKATIRLFRRACVTRAGFTATT